MTLELLQSFKFPINKSGLTDKERYIALKGQPFGMNLVTKENRLFNVNVIFNFGINQPVLQVYEGNTLIQGDTVIREYPANLLLDSKLNNYLLFYDANDSIFYFYYSEDWYNTKNGMNYWEFLEFLKKGTPK